MANDINTRTLKQDPTDFQVYIAKSGGEEGRYLLHATQQFSPSGGSPSQAVDFALGKNIKIDLSSVTGALSLSFSNEFDGMTFLIRLTQPVLSVDVEFPVNTKIENSSGNTIFGISSADPQTIRGYFDGSDFIVTSYSEAQ